MSRLFPSIYGGESNALRHVIVPPSGVYIPHLICLCLTVYIMIDLPHEVKVLSDCLVGGCTDLQLNQIPTHIISSYFWRHLLFVLGFLIVFRGYWWTLFVQRRNYTASQHAGVTYKARETAIECSLMFIDVAALYRTGKSLDTQAQELTANRDILMLNKKNRQTTFKLNEAALDKPAL